MVYWQQLVMARLGLRYITQAALDQVGGGLGIAQGPYFARNMFRDGGLIDGFLAVHRAIEQGRDVFQERELLIGTFGRLFQRHGSSAVRIGPAPRDRTI